MDAVAVVSVKSVPSIDNRRSVIVPSLFDNIFFPFLHRNHHGFVVPLGWILWNFYVPLFFYVFEAAESTVREKGRDPKAFPDPTLLLLYYCTTPTGYILLKKKVSNTI